VQHPERKAIVVLQTDGEPNVCDSTLQAVSDVALETTAPELPRVDSPQAAGRPT